MGRRRWGRRGFNWGGFLYFFLIFALLGGGIFWVVDYRLRPTLMQLAEARARQLAVAEINKIIHTQIVDEIKYEDLITVRVDSKGKVAMIQYNTGEITRVASKATVLVQESLRQITKMQIKIPFGQAFGSPILASVGPWVGIRVLPVGVVQADVEDTFEQAGINQIRHKVHLIVNAHIRLIVPLISTAVSVKTHVPIAEATIMGEVPQTYLHADGLARILGR